MTEEKLNSVLVGVSGEYFVAAELSKRGYLASITLRNTKGVDILCSSSDASKTVNIQVKSNRGSAKSWILNQKSEDGFAKNLYYVFVNLNFNDKHPDFFIVPSTVVSEYCRSTHSNWLNTPGKKGQAHKDNPMRKFDDPSGEYENRWDLLGL